MIAWVTVEAPSSAIPEGASLDALRAGIDEDGEVWAWSGIIQPRFVALMLAAEDDEPVVFDGGKEYMRTRWMRIALVTDDLSDELLTKIERKVRMAVSH